MKVKLYVWQRASLCLLFSLLFHALAFSQQVAKSIPNSTSPDGLIGFLEFRPSDYGTQKHPLIIFLHGIGERGNGTSQINSVASNAIPKFCAAGASMRFTVGGVTSSFVVLSPQLSVQYGYWPPYYVREMIKYAKANLQIDTNRIYITGLSLGGGGTWRAITDASGFDYSFDAGIAAAAPVCGTQEETDADFAGTVGANHLPIWAFHCMDDGTVPVGATQHAEVLGSILGINNPAMKFTYYMYGGHGGAWTYAYDTGHITTLISNGTNFTANPNLYEWLLSHTRATGNTAPVANAGASQSITLPVNTVTLTGSGNGTNGATLTGYSWTKVSGPASGTLVSPASATTSLTGLTAGTYQYALTVTDNHGLTASSSVTVTVSPAPNQPPVANAGSNINITLPVNSTTLNGSASNDPDGTIVSWLWTKTAGPSSFTMANATAATTAVSNLVQGVYTFNVKVTDNNGATANASVTVTVNAAAPPVNQPPVANAGSNATITLPVNSTTLNGSASNDPDGTIVSWLWTKTAGPSSFTIANATAATTAVSNLVQGVYTFNVKVTDNNGATANASITVTVNAAAPPVNQPPVANAGSNATITLPVNSTTLNGSASNDPDGTIVSWLWTKTAGPSSFTIANATAATTAVSNLVQGIYTFNLMVTDNNGATANASVTVTVNAAAPPVNQPPVANAGTNATISLPVNSTSLNGSASNDPDGTIVSWLWTKTAGPSSFTIANPTTAATVVNNLVPGVYTFNLQVTDNNSATANASVTITVNAAPPPPVNQPPVAVAGTSTYITLPVNSVTLDGSSSSDPDGSISSWLWTKTSGPSTFTIASPNAATTVINNLVQGVYTFNLQVTDNNGATANASVMVTVNAATPPPVNLPPVANAGNNASVTLPVNSFTLDGSVSADPDGFVVSYAWSQQSGPATAALASPGAATTQVTGLVQGTYVFKLVVTDNKGATASAVVTLTVNPAPNKAPVASAGYDITITLPVNTADLNGTASYDPDGSIAAYSWNKISGPGAITIVNSNTATPSVIGLAEGKYVFELTVTDNQGAKATDQVSVTVSPIPNKPPVANAGKDTTIALPANSVQLSGAASTDPDGVVNGYSWKQVSGPAAATIANQAAAITVMSNLAEGDYVFELAVTDNAGAASTARVTVTVRNNFKFSQFYKLYPNPARSTVNVQFIDDNTGKMVIKAYTADGRLVMNQTLKKDLSMVTAPVNVSELKKGLYYLEVTQNDGTKLVRPFVKQ